MTDELRFPPVEFCYLLWRLWEDGEWKLQYALTEKQSKCRFQKFVSKYLILILEEISLFQVFGLCQSFREPHLYVCVCTNKPELNFQVTRWVRVYSLYLCVVCIPRKFSFKYRIMYFYVKIPYHQQTVEKY